MTLRPLLGSGEIAQAVGRMGRAISTDHPEGLVMVAVLKGSVVLLADLVRAVSCPVSVDFIAISRYAPDSGRVRILKDLDEDIGGRDVVLVEDIVDTGLTLTYLLRYLSEHGPRNLRVCTLLDRVRRRIVPVDLAYRGVELDDEFVIGYGLDWEERYRNVDAIVSGDLAGLQGDPDLHVPELFGSAHRGRSGDAGPPSRRC